MTHPRDYAKRCARPGCGQTLGAHRRAPKCPGWIEPRTRLQRFLDHAADVTFAAVAMTNPENYRRNR